MFERQPAALIDQGLLRRRMIGYIPDRIIDRELDYLDDICVDRRAFASNSDFVQLWQDSPGPRVRIAYDFTLSFHPGL